MSNTTKTRKRRKATPEQKAKAAAKRAALMQLTRQIRALMEAGQFEDCERVNEALIQIYSEREGVSTDDWSTFKGWKEQNRRVSKGSKGFMIWGRPRNMKVNTEETNVETGETEDTEKKFKRFPICYLFHVGQTEEVTPEAKEEAEKPIRKISDLSDNEEPKQGELLLIA